MPLAPLPRWGAGNRDRLVFSHLQSEASVSLRAMSLTKSALPLRLARCLLSSWTALLFFSQIALAQEGYVGAKVCGGCHATEFATQSQSNHSRSLHPVSDTQWLEQVPTGTGSESADPEAARFEFRKGGSKYQVVLTVGTDQLVVPIQWIFGANDQGVTFLSRLDDGRFVEHRLSYYKRKKGFDITPGHHPRLSRTLEQAKGNFVSPEEAFRCVHCHSTYVKQGSAGPEFESVVPGVTCEACHGPGANHLKAVKSGATDLSIRNPGKLSGKEQVRMCGECHRNNPEPPETLPDAPIVTRFQPVGLQLSACFQKSNAAITCLTCHNPHQNVRREDDDFYNSRCLSCHTGRSTKTCKVSPAEGCIHCHMPKVIPVAHLAFSDHWIRVHKRTP